MTKLTMPCTVSDHHLKYNYTSMIHWDRNSLELAKIAKITLKERVHTAILKENHSLLITQLITNEGLNPLNKN